MGQINDEKEDGCEGNSAIEGEIAHGESSTAEEQWGNKSFRT